MPSPELARLGAHRRAHTKPAFLVDAFGGLASLGALPPLRPYASRSLVWLLLRGLWLFLFAASLLPRAFPAVESTGSAAVARRLHAGAQSLEARAVHPSGHYTATAASAFSVSVPPVAVATAYDAEGNVTSRSFADGRVQTLTWDAFNRLVKVTERDAANNGYDWSAAYDGLGRRLRTIHQPVVAGSAAGAATTIASLYDPAAEFLEIAVVVNGAIAWKVHGPDLDGRYGGWNGTGGLEAVLTPNPESIHGGFKVRAAVADAFGNIVATVAGQGPLRKVEWPAARVGGYGSLPNHRAELLGSPLRVAESSAWRGRRIDPTGFYWLSARYYEPSSGRFLSPDPYGHGSDMSLYAFANGDPVNRFDPDGRLAKRLGMNPYPADLFYPTDIWGNPILTRVYLLSPYELMSQGDWELGWNQLGRNINDQLRREWAVVTGMFDFEEHPVQSSVNVVLLTSMRGRGAPGGAIAETRIGYHATYPEVATIIRESGFLPGTRPGRLGSNGTYVNNTPEGAIAEFQHHNPGVTPEVITVRYRPGVEATATTAPRNYVNEHPLNVDSISAPSVRYPGSTNTNVMNGSVEVAR